MVILHSNYEPKKMNGLHKNQHLNKQRKSNKAKPKLIDRAVYFAAITEPALVVPQIIRIFSDQDASGVSLGTWVGFEVMTMIWVLYSIEHRQKMVFISSTLFMVVQGLVIIGGLMHGAGW